jgi:chemotaxis protein MotA
MVKNMATVVNKPKNDYSTIAGMLIALLIMGIAVSTGGKVFSFLNFPSFLIVIGGTYFVTLASFSWKEMSGLARSLEQVVFTKIGDAKEIGTQAVGIAEYAKKNGMLGLQNKEKEVERTSLLHKGMRMLVDGTTIQEVDQVLRQDIESILQRNRRSATMLRRASEIAPAMGLIGTLIGLVQMLGELDNPANIGPHMAIALLTTLYGALLSYMIITPLASKIERNSEEELILNKIYLTSVVSIGNQENPRKLERMINTILPPAKRLKIYKD